MVWYRSAVSAADSHTHHALVSRLGEGLLIGNITFHPAVGDHVTGDGRVVDSQRAFPAHHQRRLVQGLDFHAHWGTAAHWNTRKKTSVRTKMTNKKKNSASLSECNWVKIKGCGWEDCLTTCICLCCCVWAECSLPFNKPIITVCCWLHSKPSLLLRDL